LKGDGEMSMMCKDCESFDIGYDAVVDKNGDPVRIFDTGECLDCGSSNIVEERDI
jgi:hypothetical protein